MWAPDTAHTPFPSNLAIAILSVTFNRFPMDYCRVHEFTQSQQMNPQCMEWNGYCHIHNGGEKTFLSVLPWQETSSTT